MIDGIAYPVLGFCGHTAVVFPDAESLFTARRTLDRRLGRTSGTVIDSNGSMFSLSNPRFADTGSFFRLLWAILMRSRTRIEFDIQCLGPISLDEVKRKVLHVIDADTEFWEAGGDVDELRKSISGSATYDEIMEQLNR